MYVRALTLALLTLMAAGAPAEADEDWKVAAVSGRVEVSRGLAWAQIAVGDVVADADQYRTGGDGAAQLRLGRNWIHLAPHTEIDIHEEFSSRTIAVTEAAGNVGFEIKTDGAGRFLVRTPQLAAVVRNGVFGVSADEKTSTIAVRTGAVRVEDRAGLSRTDLQAGETARATTGEKLVKRALDGKDPAPGAGTPASAALNAAAAAAEIAPQSAPPPLASLAAANDKAGAAKPSGTTGAAPAGAQLDALTPLSGAAAISEVARQLPGKSSPSTPDPAAAAAALKQVAGSAAAGKAHLDVSGIAAIAGAAPVGKAKIDMGAAADALSAVAATQPAPDPSAKTADADDMDPSQKAAAKKPKPAPTAKKDGAGKPDDLSAPDPKSGKTKTAGPADAAADAKPEAAAAPEEPAKPERTLAVFSGRILPELLALDDTGRFVAGFVTVILTLVFGAILNLLMGELGFGVFGNGALVLIGALVGTEVRDVGFSGDFWVRFDPYVSLAVILGFAIATLLGAAYGRYRLLRDPDEIPGKGKPVIATIAPERLAKARIG